jgi:hypothetical protein
VVKLTDLPWRGCLLIQSKSPCRHEGLDCHLLAGYPLRPGLPPVLSLKRFPLAFRGEFSSTAKGPFKLLKGRLHLPHLCGKSRLPSLHLLQNNVDAVPWKGDRTYPTCGESPVSPHHAVRPGFKSQPKCTARSLPVGKVQSHFPRVTRDHSYQDVPTPSVRKVHSRPSPFPH